MGGAVLFGTDASVGACGTPSTTAGGGASETINWPVATQMAMGGVGEGRATVGRRGRPPPGPLVRWSEAASEEEQQASRRLDVLRSKTRRWCT